MGRQDRVRAEVIGRLQSLAVARLSSKKRSTCSIGFWGRTAPGPGEPCRGRKRRSSSSIMTRFMSGPPDRPLQAPAAGRAGVAPRDGSANEARRSDDGRMHAAFCDSDTAADQHMGRRSPDGMSSHPLGSTVLTPSGRAEKMDCRGPPACKAFRLRPEAWAGHGRRWSMRVCD